MGGVINRAQRAALDAFYEEQPSDNMGSRAIRTADAAVRVVLEYLLKQSETHRREFAGGMIPFDNAYFEQLREGQGYIPEAQARGVSAVREQYETEIQSLLAEMREAAR